VTAAPTPSILGPDFVRRTQVGWHAFFVGIMALTAFLLVADHHAAWVGVLAVWSLAYVVLARTRIFATEPGPRAWAYLVIAYTCFVIVVSVDRYAEIGLFILYPHTFAFIRRQRTAAWVAVGFTVAYTFALCVQDGFGRTSLIRNGLNGAVSVGFALILGIFISGVVTQNLRHRQLLEELMSARERLDLAEREAGALAERERFAREIHDTLAQGFLSAITLTQAAAADRAAGDLESLDRHLQRIEQTARDNLREARALVAGATPVALENDSLREAIERCVQRFAEETGMSVELAANEPGARSTRDDVVILRAAQEALANVRRHAGAHHVLVRLEDIDGLRLEVTDDGTGFDEAQTSWGFGLTGMRARVHEAGGALSVISAPGLGTSVVVRIP